MNAKQFILTCCRFACAISRWWRVGLDVFGRKSNTGQNKAIVEQHPVFNSSGSKYLRPINCAIGEKVDVYAILDAFDVRCPARQHAVKKLLCAGLRGKGGERQDLKEARDAVDRAIQMEESKRKATGTSER